MISFGKWSAEGKNEGGEVSNCLAKAAFFTKVNEEVPLDFGKGSRSGIGQRRWGRKSEQFIRCKNC